MKPARNAKFDKIDPHRKKKVFPHFRLTTGETIVFNEDIGTFHEVETPENVENVPDYQRDRAGGKYKEKRKDKKTTFEPVQLDVEVQTNDSCESVRSIQFCEPVPLQDCRPAKKESTPRKSVSYEDRVRCRTYRPPEPIEDECENEYMKSVNEIIWEKPDSDSDCSSSEEEVLIFRTQSECEIQNQMLRLMEKYGAPYIARKVLVIGRKLQQENELLKRKSSRPRRQLSDCGSNSNIGCRGILKKTDTFLEITSPVKCPHCKNKKINVERKSGPVRISINQQRQFRR